MYERRNIARRTGSRAMQHLLKKVLNANFKKGHALPDFVRNETERVEGEHLQDWLVSRLAPILGFVPPQPAPPPPDPERVRQMQGAIAQYRQNEDARVKAKQQTVECPICHRRRTIPVGTQVRCSHMSAQARTVPPPRTCEDRLIELALDLDEWAATAPIHPHLQVNDNQLPARMSEAPATRRYQGGKRVLTVSDSLAFSSPPTLREQTMMNLRACLVSGEFLRMRVCLDESCQRYFYAGHAKRTHCTSECQKHRDQTRAPGRVQRYRKKQRTNDAALKSSARALLPRLSNRKLDALETQKVLTGKASERLARLRDQFEAGIPFDQLWKQRGSRALFEKLKQAGGA